jgi:hypothetical protein
MRLRRSKKDARLPSLLSTAWYNLCYLETSNLEEKTCMALHVHNVKSKGKPHG